MVACMAVMARETWTDERLDDFRAERKAEFQRLRADMDKGFEEVKGENREVKGEVAALSKEMNARFDSMQRTLIVCFAGLAGSIAASVIGALLVTQL
jgi:hypothetical protein